MKNRSIALVFTLSMLLALVLAACNSAPSATESPVATAAAAVEEAVVQPAEEAAAEPTEAMEEAPTEEPAVAPTEAAVEEAAADAPEAMADVSGLPAVVHFPDQIAGGQPVEISTVLMPPESQPVQLAAWQAQVARFQEMYPNVTIVGTDYVYAPDSFAALVAGNQVPTLFEVYLTDPARMIEQGIPADLTSFIQEQGLEDVFNPDILDIASADGSVYGIPRFAYAMGLAYNIPMLAAAGYDTPPATWDELVEAAQALTDRDNGVAGFSFITDGSGATGWHATTLAYNFGLDNSEIVSADGDTYTASFADGPMLDAMNFVNDLRWTYDVLPRENLDWPLNGEAIATGRAAMAVMAGDQYTWIRTTYPDAPIEDFGFAPMPTTEDGQSVSLVGGNIAMVNSNATPEEIEAAVYWRLFTQFDPNEIVSNFEAGASDPTVVVGSPVLPLYVGTYQAALQALEAQYANMPVENYAPFLDAITSGVATLQPEPLVAGQEFYSAMGSVVSTIVADENTDVAAALQEAQDVFQDNVLDQLQ